MTYLTTTYRDDLTLDHARMTRDLVESEWYQARWGHLVRLKTRGERFFSNDAGGARRAVPFSSLTGGGGDRVIIDDPHSTDTIESEAERDTVTRRFREVIPFRINDPRKSAIVVVMHRLHENDVCGIIDRLKLPYIKIVLPTEYDPKRACETPIGRDPRTAPGQLLFPERFSPAYVERAKVEATGYSWSAQQQQNPVPRQGAMFDRHKVEIVSAAPAKVLSRVRAWDLALTLKRPGSDPSWTAGVLMSKDIRGLYFIEDVRRFRESGDDVEVAIKNTAAQDNAERHTKIRLPQDPGAGGKQWAQYLARQLSGKSVVVKPVRRAQGGSGRAVCVAMARRQREAGQGTVERNLP